MKRTFKWLMAVLAIMALCIGILPNAQAQVSVVDVGITNTIAAATTNTVNLGNAVPVGRFKSAAWQFQFQGNGAANSNLTVTLVRSADGTVWETTPGFTAVTALNGTTAVVGFGDIPDSTLSGAAYIKLLSIANPHATVAGTNASFKIILKKDR